MDKQSRTTQPITDRGTIGPYRLRGLLYARTGINQDAWRATLMCSGRRVARIQSTSRQGPVVVDFVGPRDQLGAQGFAVTWKYGQDNDAGQDAIGDALQELILELAEGAYHLRQLQVQSRRHTLFRLAGDAVDYFRTLRDAPYSAGREGQLRLAYGQRLIEIVRSEEATHASRQLATIAA